MKLRDAWINERTHEVEACKTKGGDVAASAAHAPANAGGVRI